MKYLSYCDFTASAGISHQKSNLMAMLREAMLADRALIAPHFWLHADHNHGRPLVSQMVEYFDYTNTTVAHQRIPILTASPKDLCGAGVVVPRSEDLRNRTEPFLLKELRDLRLVRLPLEAVYSGFAGFPVEIPTHPALMKAAREVWARVPTNAAWVHVRRGNELARTASATKPENIRRVLQKTAPAAEVVYIATNEEALSVFAPLARYYKLLHFCDFPAFKDLGAEDNYKLFLAERALGEFFSVRISTFRTPGRYYHGHLCSIPGWQ